MWLPPHLRLLLIIIDKLHSKEQINKTLHDLPKGYRIYPLPLFVEKDDDGHISNKDIIKEGLKEIGGRILIRPKVELPEDEPQTSLELTS